MATPAHCLILPQIYLLTSGQAVAQFLMAPVLAAAGMAGAAPQLAHTRAGIGALTPGSRQREKSFPEPHTPSPPGSWRFGRPTRSCPLQCPAFLGRIRQRPNPAAFPGGFPCYGKCGHHFRVSACRFAEPGKAAPCLPHAPGTILSGGGNDACAVTKGRLISFGRPAGAPTSAADRQF